MDLDIRIVKLVILKEIRKNFQEENFKNSINKINIYLEVIIIQNFKKEEKEEVYLNNI